MELIINKAETLQSLQNQFQQHYPFLKLEFYSKAHGESMGTAAKAQLANTLLIADAQAMPKEGLLHLRAGMKVSELEGDLATLFGLNVQVFRKSGNVWLQTTKTDDWTLAQQNAAAAEMNQDVAAPEAGDYHEQE